MKPSLLDPVALLTDRPAQGLSRAQVGTAVEHLDDETMLVSDRFAMLRRHLVDAEIRAAKFA
jgi:hypothetical protein